ncbi:MAG: hypothetical protein ACON4T_04110 [Synechococcus sp.]
MAELLIAGTIASSSCCAAMHVWMQAGQTARSTRELNQASALLNRHWLASHRWLATAPALCSPDLGSLAAKLELALPLAPELERSVETTHQPLGLWLMLHHPDAALKRRQLVTASGLGGCTASSTPLSPPAHPLA